MGRDMTPRDQHITDLLYPDLKFATIIEDGKNKKQHCLYDFSSEFGIQYPNLYFLLGEEHMQNLQPDTLATFERHLVHIINADDAKRPLPVPSTPEIKSMLDWYHGKLDPHFYYRTENNRRLADIMLAWQNRKNAHK